METQHPLHSLADKCARIYVISETTASNATLFWVYKSNGVIYSFGQSGCVLAVPLSNSLPTSSLLAVGGSLGKRNCFGHKSQHHRDCYKENLLLPSQTQYAVLLFVFLNLILVLHLSTPILSFSQVSRET